MVQKSEAKTLKKVPKTVWRWQDGGPLVLVYSVDCVCFLGVMSQRIYHCDGRLVCAGRKFIDFGCPSCILHYCWNQRGTVFVFDLCSLCEYG